MELTKPRVAVLGTGRMGRPMAERLLAAEYPVTVWNRTRDRAQPLADLGASVADLAEDAVTSADGVILMLADVTAIQQTVLTPACRAALIGRTVLQMGTIGGDESRALEREITTLGGQYLEAPVLGSIPEATDGSLIVMVGASRALFERWHEVLRCFGSEPRLVGEVGAAAALKLAMNQLIAGLTSAYALSLGLVRRAGVDVEAFAATVRASALCAPTFDKKLQRMVDRDFQPGNFPARLLLKDVRLMITEAERIGLCAPTLDGIRELLERTVSSGLGDADYSALSAAVDPDTE